MTTSDAGTGTTYVLQFRGAGLKTMNGAISNSTAAGSTSQLPVLVQGNTGAGTGPRGVTTFTNANTYGGGTYITGTTFVANNTSGSATGTGAVTVTNATFNFTNGSGITTTASGDATSFGILAGNGSIDGPITLAQNGSLRPGTNVAGTTANLSSGNATANALTFGTGSSALFDVSPTGNDAFTALTGGVNYGGAFTVNLTTLPAAGLTNTYTLFNTLLKNGDFASIALAGSVTGALADTAGVWTGTFGTDAVTFSTATGVLTVTDTTVVPEPAALGLLGLSGLVATGRRRRSA